MQLTYDKFTAQNSHQLIASWAGLDAAQQRERRPRPPVRRHAARPSADGRAADFFETHHHPTATTISTRASEHQQQHARCAGVCCGTHSLGSAWGPGGSVSAAAHPMHARTPPAVACDG